ncbi:hypothetical protein [Pleomorphomonas sp. T1.2MG-36]|uniref:hypothetical protein n=1 Tax=Pleomorphomonas sp. T1.2MG-36 TaxID=3041167 RepID=UPI002542320F|nr:hypothetical protein [Pleomorphomonas sp. T1.2MG-36]
MSEFYIKRRFRLGDKVLTEAELLLQSGPIIVLAEPGAGKTRVMRSMATSLGAKWVRASRFRNTHYTPKRGPLVIDAMDEVAKIGGEALNDIVEKAQAHADGLVIFSSRSGEWEKSRSKYVEECFGTKPKTVHLDAFNLDEQRALFAYVFPEEDFDDFVREASRCDLNPLLSNPEFLQFFGYGYIENNRRFDSKQRAYSDAARRLAQESNESQSMRGRPEAATLVRQAGSVFARLLLSGASGVSRVEKIDDREFPYVDIVDGEVEGGLDHLLDSKLFRPAGDANEHEPFHRILAEYLGANYLTEHIADAGSGLSLRRCFAIIAPNGVVRDELRGMLGWMAALGGDRVQRAAIDLDPYAVLSNGDPAQLHTANKIHLIRKLQEVAETDPYFRRGDYWRSFNVGNFFSEDVVDALRPILAVGGSYNLRTLVLDLLNGTSAIASLVPELEAILLDPTTDSYSRIFSMRLLVQISTYTVGEHFETLIAQGDPAALQALAEYVEAKSGDVVGEGRLLALLRACAALFPKADTAARRDGMSRYFIKHLLRELKFHDIGMLLDAITSDISCTCMPRHEYRCHCRDGISKVVGGLLDRYFTTVPGPYDARRVWSWVKDLRFTRHIEADASAAVAVLRKDHKLRRAIQKVAFLGATSSDIAERLDHLFYADRTHSGVRYELEDIDAAIADAFSEGNTLLWDALWRPHSPYNQHRGPDAHRKTMRAQANNNSDFMRVWASRDRIAKAYWRRTRDSWEGRRKRHQKLAAEQEASRLESLRQNRAAIEAGQHWWWLQHIAHRYLYEPDKLADFVGDVEIAHKALRNCLPFLNEHVPSLESLAAHKWGGVAMALYAHCLLHYREKGNLDGIQQRILEAAKTQAGNIVGMAEGEAEAFEAEIDRLIFTTASDIETFAKRYIEPTLRDDEPDSPTNVGWLTYKGAFQGISAKLSTAWLRSYPDMPYHAETSLFEIAASHAPRDELLSIVRERLLKHAAPLPSGALERDIHRREFWLLNAFIFLEGDVAWNILKQNRDSLLLIAARMDRFGSEDGADSPPLSPRKNYQILEAFVDEWPPVDLPDSYGSDSPKEERAYRYLREIPGRISRGPPDEALPILDKLLEDDRFIAYRADLIGVRAVAARRHALQHFRAPSPSEISALLEKQGIASVEDMRAAAVEMLQDVEAQIRTSETDTIRTFYPAGTRVDENTARSLIVDQLRAHLRASNMADAIEFHMAGGNRCDIAALAMIERKRRLLTIEVKGQWHSALFTAAAEQLSTRYSSNRDAEQQGIYLVLWFGPDELVAGRKNTIFRTPRELKQAIVEQMPLELRRRIDVVVIDLTPRASD